MALGSRTRKNGADELDDPEERFERLREPRREVDQLKRSLLCSILQDRMMKDVGVEVADLSRPCALGLPRLKPKVQPIWVHLLHGWQHNYEPVGGSLALSALAPRSDCGVSCWACSASRRDVMPPRWRLRRLLRSAFTQKLAAALRFTYGAAYGLFLIAWLSPVRSCCMAGRRCRQVESICEPDHDRRPRREFIAARHDGARSASARRLP
jgi:hypothetical protein